MSDPAAEDIDVDNLNKDKIKELMRRDPKFINRLITGLDKQMHKLMAEKLNRKRRIEENMAEIARLDEQIRTHITPHLTRLEEDITLKSEFKGKVTSQLQEQVGNFKKLERQTASAVSAARHASGKLYGQTAQDTLLKLRGYSTQQPTTELLRTGKKVGKAVSDSS